MVNTIHTFMDTRRIRTWSSYDANMALQPLVDASTLGFISNERVFRLVYFSHFQKVNKNQTSKISTKFAAFSCRSEWSADCSSPEA